MQGPLDLARVHRELEVLERSDGGGAGLLPQFQEMLYVFQDRDQNSVIVHDYRARHVPLSEVEDLPTFYPCLLRLADSGEPVRQHVVVGADASCAAGDVSKGPPPSTAQHHQTCDEILRLVVVDPSLRVGVVIQVQED